MPDLGCQVSIFVRPGADTAAIDQKMKDILTYIWENRKEFEVFVSDIDTALNNSLSCRAPVHISELGDIVSAGGASDSSVALRALLRHPEIRPACVTIMDKATQEIGLNNSGDFMMGGEVDHGYNTRAAVNATVQFFNGDKIAPTGNTEKGMLFDMGMRVTLKTDDDLYIIVSEYPNYNHDKSIMLSMNVDPTAMKVVIQKTHQMFKEGYRGIIGTALYADTEGFTDRNIPRLPFKNVRRPLYPLDDIQGAEAPIR